MAAINAADVAKLRRVTLAGMMDCKKALEEAEGNFDKAIEIIRKKGQAVANKRADKEATEGVVLSKASSNGKLGVMIVLNSETDFVAKNADFIALANKIIDTALAKNPADLDGLKALQLEGGKIGDKVVEYVGIIGEKLELSYYEKIEAEHVQAYIHPGNRLATLVGFTKAGIDPQVYKDIAMQVAAMSPVAVDKDSVPQSVIAQEIEIGKEQARRDGKPEEMLEKIAQGKLTKFFKESTLLNQDFVKDNKMTIKQYLQSVNKELTVTDFKRFTLNL
ncbi:MAG: translation elongation factor Ts [Bacteroidetes bacterium GWE2_41_25]|nr:MAG: translation elongation factor Ts [Bacteroidetes bacterium GWA2_40_15]OFX84674.1 MAG: translation elongation factor Ts [Bacteroidetes bacterium GWC2_40_22]OFY03735.1 MAG: translation elongation factor Ts [Bacteroidetes bacterium GWE2_41_25]OFY62026.1 MAG: translation elongation factor Ts [Bacteroidetes bacterium GWF2_41_9]HBH83355.1 elongation factor Ts [Bacteroidales bacterium]